MNTTRHHDAQDRIYILVNNVIKPLLLSLITLNMNNPIQSTFKAIMWRVSSPSLNHNS